MSSKTKSRTPAAPAAPETTSADAAEKDVERLEQLLERRRKALAGIAKLAKPEPAPAAESEVPGNDRVAEVLEELQGRGSFDINKIEIDGTKQFGPWDLNLWPEGMETAFAEGGTGTYMVFIRDSEGRIQTRYKRAYKAAAAAGSPAAPAPVAATAADPLKFFEIMQLANDRHSKDLQEMRLEMAKIQAQATQQLIEVLKANNQGGFLKNAQDVAAIGAMFKDKSNPIEDLLNARELLDDLRGGDEKKPAGPWAPLVSMLAAALTPILLKAKAADTPRKVEPPKVETPPAPRADGLLAPPPPPGPAPQPAAATTPPVQPPAPAAAAAAGDGEKKISLLAHLPTIVSAISDGYMPVSAATSIWKMADASKMTNELLDMFEDGDWDELKAQPDLAGHAAWVDELRAVVMGFEEKPPQILEPS